MSSSRPKLDPADYQDLVRRALEEDVGTGDITTRATVAPSRRGRAQLVAKSPLVLAGLDIAEDAFRQADQWSVVTRHLDDGDHCPAGVVVAEIDGSAAGLLTAERTALNFLQRLSGIATMTRRFVDAAAGRITILDTRKTTPTLRALEKYAVRCGGGTNHRFGLFDAILIKDNHARLAGGIGAAVERMRAAARGLPIEVEAQSLADVDAAIAARADIILLDNLTIAEIRDALGRIAGRARTEISGGVTLDRLPELAATGADFVSVGGLTHSAPAADLSLEIGERGTVTLSRSLPRKV
ncbi:MAG: carboxylating nicotinate-nucleotide diphosphorylase [Acidobacteria bacterium]|nr:carboxylating nicotinate-nucleotide diphosphorylase [Acidobacteriota bacterium]